MGPQETVRALLEARAAHDASRIAELLDDSVSWTTPRGKTYGRLEIEPSLSEDESGEGMVFSRELRELRPLDGERVLALYDEVYAWPEDGLANRVAAGGVFTVRNGKVAGAVTFLDAEKASAAA